MFDYDSRCDFWVQLAGELCNLKQGIELNILSIHAFATSTIIVILSIHVSATSTIIVTQFRQLGQFLLSPSINPFQKDLVAPDCKNVVLFLSAERIRCTDDKALASCRNKCELSFWNAWGIALDAALPKVKWLTAFEQKWSCENLYRKVISKQHQSFDVVSKSRPI